MYDFEDRLLIPREKVRAILDEFINYRMLDEKENKRIVAEKETLRL